MESASSAVIVGRTYPSASARSANAASTSISASAAAVSWIAAVSATTFARKASKSCVSSTSARAEAPAIFSSRSFNSGVVKRSPFTIVCLRW